MAIDAQPGSDLADIVLIRGCSAISLSQAAVIAAFSAGDGLLPARPPTYIQARFATAAPRLHPALLARCQTLLAAPGFDHRFRIAALAHETAAATQVQSAASAT